MYSHNRRPLALFFLLSLLFCSLSVSATTANVTVDDQYGDEISGALPAYSPVGSWSQGNGCSTCALRPDPADAFNDSWHDTTFSAGGPQRTITVNFTGIAVYAFFIVPDAAQGDVTVDTDLIFTLDGEQAGNYSHSPTGGADFLYDEPCFAIENLVNGSHQLVMSATAPPNSSTAVLFDYLIYTSSTNSSTVTSPGSSANSSATALLSSTSSTALPSSTSSTGASPPETPTHTSHVSTGAVVGGTIGGIAAAVALLLLLLRCRKSQSRYIPPADVQSPMSDGSTRASRYDLFSPRKTPSELEVHPAVFDEPKPEDGSPTARQRPYFHSYLRDSENELRPAQNISTLTATQTTDGRLSSKPASPSASNNNADIVSQVAALQATVRSLQKQRVNPRHSIISESGEPPAYSHDL